MSPDLLQTENKERNKI